MANAEIYQKNVSDKCLILEPGVGWKQPFDLGTWAQLAIAMYWSATTGTDDNAVPPATEDSSTGSVNSILAWGLKTDDLLLPGTAGCKFVGITGNLNTTVAARYNITSSSEHRIQRAGASDLRYGTVIDTTFTNSSGEMARNTGNAMATDTLYASYFALRFTIAGSGTAAQTIAVARATTNPSTSSPTINNLRTSLGTVGFTAVVTLAWNDGATAYAIPTSMFLRFPFVNTRVRIHAYVIEKLS